jgi:TolA-binding protein
LAGKEDEAAKAFEELAQKHPESPLANEAQYNAGERAYQAKDYAAAAKAYYQVVQQTDGTPLGEKATHKLAWCYYHLGNYPNSEKTFAYQVKRYADGPLADDARFMQAECLFKANKFSEAVAAYEGLKSFSKPDFEMLSLLHAGQAAGQLNDWKKSAAVLKRCVDRFPEAPAAPEALYELGWATQNLGNKDEALKLYEQVVAKTDREVAARAHFMIGEVHFENKNHEEAIKSFFKAAYAYSYPKWQAEAMYEAGRCFEALDKRAKAVEMYQELVGKFPTSERVALAKQRLADLKR